MERGKRPERRVKGRKNRKRRFELVGRLECRAKGGKNRKRYFGRVGKPECRTKGRKERKRRFGLVRRLERRAKGRKERKLSLIHIFPAPLVGEGDAAARLIANRLYIRVGRIAGQL